MSGNTKYYLFCRFMEKNREKTRKSRQRALNRTQNSEELEDSIDHKLLMDQR